MAEAWAVGLDARGDSAVLSVDPPASRLWPVAPRDADSLQVSRLAIASGSPCGQTCTRTRGILSGLGRTLYASGNPYAIPEVSRTDAAINPGNSGRPLQAHKGRAMGMKTRILSRDRPGAGYPPCAGERSQHWFHDADDRDAGTPETEAQALFKQVYANRPASQVRASR